MTMFSVTLCMNSIEHGDPVNSPVCPWALPFCVIERIRTNPPDL